MTMYLLSRSISFRRPIAEAEPVTYRASTTARCRVSALSCSTSYQSASTNAIKLIENALKEARRGVFRVRSCRGFEKMRMPNRRRGTPPEKL